MKFSPRSLVVLAFRLTRQSRSSEALRAPLYQVRHIHQKPFEHHQDGFVPLQLSFESVGVRQRIATACRAAFPTIKHPTMMQSRLIEAVMSGDDILLRDDTGTGKTFALVLALLSKERVKPPASKSASSLRITSLFIVPHAALAAQIQYWIKRMSETVENQGPESFPLICQTILRDAANPPERQASLLREAPPHLLLATPNGLQDVYAVDPGALQLETVSTIVVDEADEMIPAVPALKKKKKMEAIRKRVEKHAVPVLRMLELIYVARIKFNLDPQQAGGERRYGLDPQLIISSATLRTSLRQYLYGEKGLLRRGHLQKILGTGPEEHEMLEANGTEGEKEVHGDQFVGQARTAHSAVLVSPGGKVKNIPGAIMASERPSKPEDPGSPGDCEGHDLAPLSDTLGEVNEDIILEAPAATHNTPSPFNAEVFYTIATYFALDVPMVALLVLPSSAPVKRAVSELRELGVNAQPIDLTANQRIAGDFSTADPTLLVTTLASIRGLDIPELTHVFLIAVPGLTPDEYLHVAGRVGRFGREGHVVCVLEAEKQKDVGVMGRIYNKLEISPVTYEHAE